MKTATVQIYFWLILAILIACKPSNRISKINSNENESLIEFLITF
jgi:hypothetical protein